VGFRGSGKGSFGVGLDSDFLEGREVDGQVDCGKAACADALAESVVALET